ncbi:hypothetical protein LIPSTDRAFT_101623 [Lipomyces starkeyi NRRL Y-11557]|uniref:Uncharacterized protein n=1 Tax=Lipomyces starkeyi NRRL Y-11557 TaxID=675824 RepID=A0A1E3QH62_LIPST|nr:hypothetical protein LIPSTDRAFT_101623 [Lipomyces starkeyi NRRL Y-11557]
MYDIKYHAGARLILTYDDMKAYPCSIWLIGLVIAMLKPMICSLGSELVASVLLAE